MENMKKFLFLFVAVLLTTVSVNAMSKDELKDKLTKSYTINGVTYKLNNGNANMVKSYLEQNEVSESDCDYIAAQVDKAVAIIKDAKVFYGINVENIKNKLQTMINGLDLNSLNTLFDQIGDVFAKENAETMEMLGELKDFKDIIKKD